jgi:hypothetical protein
MFSPNGYLSHPTLKEGTTFPTPHRSPPLLLLRVSKSPPAPSSTFSGGLAGWRGWRDGDRPLYRFVVRLVLGCMPVVWSRISDLFGQIGGCLGCSARFLQLRWPEVNQSTVITACWSKHLDLLWSAVAAGGEERVPLQVSLFSGRPWWRGEKGRRSMLHISIY